MKNTPIFQIILIAIFSLLAIGGIIAFALFGGIGGNSSQVGKVVIWGPLDSRGMSAVLETLKQADKKFDQVTYVEKNADTYESDLINAIASGSAPDLFILPEYDTVRLSDKVAAIPYSVMSQGTYSSTYVDEAGLFVSSNGYLALPVYLDPLVMYWNNDQFSSAGIAVPPFYWSQLLLDAPKLTKVDASSNLVRGAVGLGLWSNITHVKELFSALIMQAGDQIVVNNSGSYKPVFGVRQGDEVENPAESALRFYTDFANPSKTVYSWNRSQPSTYSAFTAGKVAMYFGLASEYAGIKAVNPNLHFSVAPLPQAQGQNSFSTYGRMYGVAIPKNAGNPNGALAVAVAISGSVGISAIADQFGIPPVRRDLIKDVQNDAVRQVFMQSALIARGWLDPDPSATDRIFKTMIESVVSGSQGTADAVSAASQSFSLLFPQI